MPSDDVADRGDPQSCGLLRRTVEPYATDAGASDFSRIGDEPRHGHEARVASPGRHASPRETRSRTSQLTSVPPDSRAAATYAAS